MLMDQIWTIQFDDNEFATKGFSRTTAMKQQWKETTTRRSRAACQGPNEDLSVRWLSCSITFHVVVYDMILFMSFAYDSFAYLIMAKF